MTRSNITYPNYPTDYNMSDSNMSSSNMPDSNIPDSNMPDSNMPDSNKEAGKVIAAGGFGCVFKPALKCKNEATRGTGISKMMMEYEAFEEYDEIQNVKSKLKNIPNYDKYFLINGINLCIPDALTDDDKINFQSKCGSLLSTGTTPIRNNNINNKLDKLRILNEPDGGDDIEHWISNSNNFTPSKFHKLNIALIKLMKYGIIPMNKKKVYHFDIKGSNILMDNSDIARLIDWGLIGISTSKQIIPEIIKGRSLQFNCPPTSLLLGDEFNDWYPKKLKADKSIQKNSPILYEKIRQIASDYYNFQSVLFGKGHEDYIYYILERLYKTPILGSQRDDTTIFCDYYKALIIGQFTNVLMKYTDFSKNKFNAEKYFLEVFRYNVDIWGLLTCYIDIINIPQNLMHIKKKDFFNKLRYVIIKYLYRVESCSIKYNYKQLFADLVEVSKTGTKKQFALSPVKQTKKVNKINKVNKAKKTIKPKNTTRRQQNSFSWSKKRCPKGHRRNKRTRKCVKV
jgi:hypothetical protein